MNDPWIILLSLALLVLGRSLEVVERHLVGAAYGTCCTAVFCYYCCTAVRGRTGLIMSRVPVTEVESSS